jgi:hypothetical protein
VIHGRGGGRGAITDLAPQHARDDSTGAEVYNDGREHVVYEFGGRRWRPYVERGRVAAIYLDRTPSWDDGTPLADAELAQAREVLGRIYRHWKGEVEFVAPDGSAR